MIDLNSLKSTGDGLREYLSDGPKAVLLIRDNYGLYIEIIYAYSDGMDVIEISPVGEKNISKSQAYEQDFNESLWLPIPAFLEKAISKKLRILLTKWILPRAGELQRLKTELEKQTRLKKKYYKELKEKEAQ